MKLKVRRFRFHPPHLVAAASTNTPGLVIGDDAFFPVQDDGFGPGLIVTNGPAGTSASVDSAAPLDSNVEAAALEIEAIPSEELTARQLRLARRLAQHHALPATSDLDAVRVLRRNGIDPFQRVPVMEIVAATASKPDAEAAHALTVTKGDSNRVPQTAKTIRVPAIDVQSQGSYVADIQRIQQDIARRRRLRAALLAARLFVFVMLPTMTAAWYYYFIATPLYVTQTEFLIQKVDPAAASGMPNLFSGTQFATSQDSVAVQGYLQSREAMMRLDLDKGFRAHFQAEGIDPIQRLAPDATDETVYKTYKRNVRIAYDPTEGLVKMEVIAASPQVSHEFSIALLRYAEEQIDQLTQRLREDQMQGARQSFEDAEAKMLAAQRRVVELQESFKVLSSEAEASLIIAQMGPLETQLLQDRVSLAQMESNKTPNAARMEPLKRRITTLEGEIALLRARLTEGQAGGQSLAQIQSELLIAQADVQTRHLLLAQSLQAMETARVEANRQTRYLSVSVNPGVPDEATYPRAFENTLVVMLILMAIYLMIAMTNAILREQLTT